MWAPAMSISIARGGKPKDPNPNAVVYILDSKDDVLRKFRRAVTDSGSEVRYDEEGKPGIANLMSIYRCFTGR